MAIVFALTAPVRCWATDCQPDDDACWRAQFKELCREGGEQWCQRLVDHDGAWKKPKWEVVESLKTLAPEIEEAGKKFGVDPRAIAAAVFAENSLNVTQVDNFEDFLVKTKIARKGKVPILNKKFSFGWGQLYMEAALAAEPVVAKVEGRKRLRTQEEIAKALEVPKEAMQYIAGVMKRSQDIYAAAGFDISKRPELLATVYNLGKPEKLVQRTKASGRLPEVNFFGFFVEHYMHVLERTLNEGIAEAKESGSGAITRKAVTRDLDLYRFPPRCENDSSSKDAEYQKIASYVEPPRVSELHKGSTYEILSPGLGCRVDGDKEDWSLVRGENGAIGWVSDDTLYAASTKVVRSEKPCPTPKKQKAGPGSTSADMTRVAVRHEVDTLADPCDDPSIKAIFLECRKPASERKRATPPIAPRLAACSRSVRSKLGRLDLGASGESEIEVSLSSAKGSSGTQSALSYKRPNISCEGNWSGGAAFGGFAGAGGATNFYNVPPNGIGTPNVQVKPEKIQELKKEIEDFKKRMMKSLGVAGENSLYLPSNPYASILTNMLSQENWDDCLPQNGKAPKDVCYFMSNDPLKDLAKIPVPPEPTYPEWIKIRDAVLIPWGSSPAYVGLAATGKGALPAEAIAQRKKNILKLLEPCAKLDSNLTKSQAFIRQVYETVDRLDTNSTFFRPTSDYMLQQAASSCQLIDQITHPTEQADCPQCAAQNGTVWLGNINVDTSTMKVLLRKPEDRDTYLADALGKAIPNYLLTAPTPTQSPGDDSGCSSYLYDPFLTAKKIQSLLKDSCVRAVYVPDPWLVNRFNDQSARVIYRPFLTDDRYSVELSGSGCEGLASAGDAR